MIQGSYGEATPDGWEPLDDECSSGKLRFMVTLGKPQLDKLREQAEQQKTSVAELVRRAVDEYLLAREE